MSSRLRRVAHCALICSALLAVPSMALFAQSTATEADRSTPVLELRYRYEQVDDAAFARDAEANTVRLRLGYHKALVAIANKHARMIWAILAKGEAYDPEAWRRLTPQPV